MDIVYAESVRGIQLLETLELCIDGHVGLVVDFLSKTADNGSLSNLITNEPNMYSAVVHLCAAIVEYLALVIEYLNRNKFGIPRCFEPI